MEKLSFWKKITLFCLLFLIFLVPFFKVHAITEFTRDIRVGDRGEDVRVLQRVLNSDPRTVITSEGPGSIGQETDYFGVKTKNAVMKFQTLYLPEILGVAQDSIVPTGFVGPITRKKLNNLLANSLNPQSITDVNGTHNIPVPLIATSSAPTISSPSPLAFTPEEQKKGLALYARIMDKTKPTLFSLSQYEASPATVITAIGQGFVQNENTVHFGEQYVVSSVASNEGKTLTFDVPKEIPNGKYNVWISNKNGDTKSFYSGDYFVITTNPRKPPAIGKISPDNLSMSDTNTEITITGTNFDSLHNSLYSTLGNILSLPSSDGKTIRIKLSDFPIVQKLPSSHNGATGYSLQVTLYVVTDAGASVTPGTFLIRF